MKSFTILGTLGGAVLALAILSLGLTGPVGWGVAVPLTALAGAFLAAMSARWYRQSITDALTGLSCRRHLFQRLEVELKRSRKHGYPLALIVIDVDDFRQYNNRHGHLMGDQVLLTVARTIRAGVRKGDLVGRWGGEEFAVVLPGATLEEGIAVAERVRTLMQTRRLRSRGEEFGVTVSAGVALARSASVLELVERADQAMYVAKQQKDQVQVALA